MASTQQNRNFAEVLLTNYPLEEAIEWIKDNLDPDQVFDENQLVEYVRANYNIDDVYKENDILPHVVENYEPDDVFEDSSLEDWAEQNGYVRE